MKYSNLSFAIAAVLIFFAVPCIGEIKAASLCEKTEKVALSCLTENKKILSLCSDGDDSQEITYRFGKPGRVEKTYRATKKNEFFANHYFRNNVDYKKIAFYVFPYKYEIFHYYDAKSEGKDSYGVSVIAGDEEKAQISCVLPVIDHLNDLMKRVACDEKDALGCDPY